MFVNPNRLDLVKLEIDRLEREKILFMKVKKSIMEEVNNLEKEEKTKENEEHINNLLARYDNAKRRIMLKDRFIKRYKRVLSNKEKEKKTKILNT